MKDRWGSDSSIKDRYFVNGKSSRALSRNGVARLWWFAHLTYDEHRQNPYELTEVLLSNQDIQHNLLERNFGRNRVLFRSLLDFIRHNPDKFSGAGGVKAGTKSLGKLINRWGGVKMLDCLLQEEIYRYLQERF